MCCKLTWIPLDPCHDHYKQILKFRFFYQCNTALILHWGGIAVQKASVADCGSPITYLCVLHSEGLAKTLAVLKAAVEWNFWCKIVPYCCLLSKHIKRVSKCKENVCHGSWAFYFMFLQYYTYKSLVLCPVRAMCVHTIRKFVMREQRWWSNREKLRKRGS